MIASEPPAVEREDELSEELARLGSLLQTEQGASPIPAEISRKEIFDDQEINFAQSSDGDLYGPARGRNVVPDWPRERESGDGVSVAEGLVDEEINVQILQPKPVVESVPLADEKAAVHPVPHPKLRLVNPVPRAKKTAARASGSTSKKQTDVHPVPHKGKSKDDNRLHPPTISGHKWKPSGLSGWELYTRKPSISANGKRSSTGDYLAYYSKEAVRRLHEQREKANNARTA